jgi:hypothetical protein
MTTSEDDNEKDYQVWFYYAGISGSIEVTAQDEYNAVRKATLRLYRLFDEADTFEITDVVDD